MVYLQRSLQVINPLNKHLAESVCCRFVSSSSSPSSSSSSFCRSSLSSSAFGIACQHHPGESDNDNRPWHVAMLRRSPCPPMRCLLLIRHVATPCMGRHLLSLSTSFPSPIHSCACLPARSRLTMRMRLVAIHCDSFRCVVCRG